MMKKVLSFILAVCMLASLACILPVSATEDDGWTYINFNEMLKFSGTTANNAGAGTWETTERTAQYTTTATTYNAGLYDINVNNKLADAKEYLISVDMKFSKAYATTTSGATALVFGINGATETVTPWNTGSGASCFCAMFQRSNATPMRIFNIAASKSTTVELNTKVSNDLTAELISLADTWINVTIHVRANDTMIVYLNGVAQKGSYENKYTGGNIGLVTHTIVKDDPVSFKDLKYKAVSSVEEPSDNTVASAYWNNVDISGMTETALTNTSWTYSNDKVLTGSATNVANNVNMLSTSPLLDYGTAYTIEVQARFKEAYASGKSVGFGLVWGSATNASTSAWGTNNRYCAMVHRTDATYGASVFGGGNFGGAVKRAEITRKLTDAEKETTDWFTIRVTITEGGLLTFYLNGEQVGNTQKTVNNGGYLGLIAYDAKSGVDFRNLRYTEGIVDENKVDYVGTSVRIDEFSGIRVKSAISAELTSATIAEDGFTVVEYGTLVAKAENYKTAAMTVGATGVQKAIAYNATTDTYFERTETETVYTIVLHNIANSKQEYAFRAYYVVEYEDGTTETFYQTYNGSYNLVKSLYGVAEQIAADPNATADELAYANSILGN